MCKDWIETWLYSVATETGINIDDVKKIADEAENLEEFWMRIHVHNK